MVTVLAENGKFDLLHSLPTSKNLNAKMCWRLVCSMPARLVPLLPPFLDCKSPSATCHILEAPSALSFMLRQREILVLGLVSAVLETISVDTASRLRAELEALSGEVVHELPAGQAVNHLPLSGPHYNCPADAMRQTPCSAQATSMQLLDWLGCRTCFCDSCDDSYWQCLQACGSVSGFHAWMQRSCRQLWTRTVSPHVSLRRLAP